MKVIKIIMIKTKEIKIYINQSWLGKWWRNIRKSSTLPPPSTVFYNSIRQVFADEWQTMNMVKSNLINIKLKKGNLITLIKVHTSVSRSTRPCTRYQAEKGHGGEEQVWETQYWRTWMWRKRGNCKLLVGLHPVGHLLSPQYVLHDLLVLPAQAKL